MNTETKVLPADDIRSTISSIYEFLAEEGYRPEIQDSGNLAFKAEGRRYVIILDDEDVNFIRFCAMNLTSHFELTWGQAVEYSNKVNSKFKIAKASCIERDGVIRVSVDSEHCYSKVEHFIDQLDRLLGAIRNAVDYFYELISEAKQECDVVSTSSQCDSLH